MPHPWLPEDIFDVPAVLPFCPPVSSSISIFLWLYHCARLVTEKVKISQCLQSGGGKRIWLMHIPSLCIQHYILESVRKTWLIQVEVLIEVLSFLAADFPSFIFQYSSPSLSFSVGPISVPLFSHCSLTPPHFPFILSASIDWMWQIISIRHHLAHESEGFDPVWTGDERWFGCDYHLLWICREMVLWWF